MVIEMDINLDEFLETEHITKAYEVVGEWEFVIENCPERLKIKVVKRPDGKFIGIANFLIQEPGRSNPYLSHQIKDSVHDALKESIAGFLANWSPSLANQIKLFPYEGY